MSSTVAIFKIGLLPFTQTFIPAQVSALRKFDPVYVGLDRVANGRCLESRSCVLVGAAPLSLVFKRLFIR